MAFERALVLLAALPLFACPAGDDAGDGPAPDTGSMPTTDATSSPATTVAATDESGAGMTASTGGGGGELTWGAPCTTDDECVALIGDGAICSTMAVIYELPGGYCTKPCSLPDGTSTVVQDDPACDPNGGVDCIGSMGIYETCAKPCTTSAECRDMYQCQQMPMIAQPTDPTYCLMDLCCEADCSDC